MKKGGLAPIGSVLAGRRAGGRLDRPMRQPSLASEVAGLSLMDVIVAARRAQHAMVLEMDVPARLALKSAEVRPEVTADAKAAGLAVAKKWCERLRKKHDQARKKRVALTFGRGECGAGNKHSQPDDATPADGMWLQMTLLCLPGLREHRVKPLLRNGQMATRGAWRRAVAQLMTKPPQDYARLSGALLTALSKASQAKEDVRVTAGYCVKPGWDDKLIGFANVRSKIHGPKYCPSCDGAGRLCD